MADATPEQQQEQYAAIELLYSEGKWPEVLQSSEALLADLSPVQDHPLRPRLELVIGHTLLYGLADLDGAEQRYRAVLVTTQEQVLREIAEQGLLRCQDQRQATAALEPEAQAEAAVMPWDLAAGTDLGGTGVESADGGHAAMPWLVELGSEPAPAVEPVVEPPHADSARTVRNLKTASLDPSPRGTPASHAPQAPHAGAPTASGTSTSTTVAETLALLREPDALIPVTVEVLEEPPLSPDEMAELARGLLDVVLR